MIKDTILEYHKQLVDMGYKTRFQVSNAGKCVYSSLCEGGCPYNQYIQGKWMSRDCQKSYLDFANKAIFSQEIFGDITFKEISKIKTLTVES
ncbi:hypothetical protein [Pseudolactococcus carnosus]|uniref:hypothetical protein n=1 Tax=Pseudolactococcus carnosus TaxID=2749961 RepID=UPI000BC4EA24|nr:hypothetical protein [Lactococcus carnosus]SOB46857.1 hypothetical protein LPICM17_110048 [Lactococcus piscium]MCJ1968909.1 hypothetical protein [Lactococcus carnosus]MCJ1991684.1 hypothetical protein [Lactococcus carnosus]MCJ1999884.1 hypothetical protein [Lactococcus carnosus]QDJ26559.1 hypothetical protein BHS00_08375 [Lactococcus carnosus]